MEQIMNEDIDDFNAVSVDIDVTATAAAQFDWMDACAIHTTIEEENETRQILVKTISQKEKRRRRTIIDFSHSLEESPSPLHKYLVFI